MERNWILTMSSLGINIFTSFILITAADNLFFFSINNEIKYGCKTMFLLRSSNAILLNGLPCNSIQTFMIKLTDFGYPLTFPLAAQVFSFE